MCAAIVWSPPDVVTVLFCGVRVCSLWFVFCFFVLGCWDLAFVLVAMAGSNGKGAEGVFQAPSLFSLTFCACLVGVLVRLFVVDPHDVEVRRRVESLFSLFVWGDSLRTRPPGQVFWVARHIVPEQPVVLHRRVRQELMEAMFFTLRFINSWPEEVHRAFLGELEGLIDFMIAFYLPRGVS